MNEIYARKHSIQKRRLAHLTDRFVSAEAVILRALDLGSGILCLC